MANEQIKQDLTDYLNRELTGDFYDNEEKVEQLYEAYRLGHELLSPDGQTLEWNSDTDTWSIANK